MWRSIQHNDAYGPFSSKYKNGTGEEASIDLAERNGVASEQAAAETPNVHAASAANAAMTPGHIRNTTVTSTTGPEPYPNT